MEELRLATAPTEAFCTTRVHESTEEDWSKLRRMMIFLINTKDDKLVIKNDGDRKVNWFVDASFAVHPDYKSQSGMMMTMGQGALKSSSMKQKINTRSSTEAELVAVDDMISSIVWTKNFLIAQGYDLKDNILFQDNTSAIKLEENGRKSIGKRSRHLNIRLFFITDQVEKGNVSIEYCPTTKMKADYFTKALQGNKFKQLRKEILNLPAAGHSMLMQCLKI